MVPDFISTRDLLTYRRWRPEQVDALLGRPDAIFAIWHGPALGKRRRAFFRDRVEAAEQTVAFRVHEDRPEKPQHRWMVFRDVVFDLLDTTASRYCGAPTHEDIKRLAKPIFRVDDSGVFRCKTCGAIHFCYNDAYFNRCSHKLPIPATSGR